MNKNIKNMGIKSCNFTWVDDWGSRLCRTSQRNSPRRPRFGCSLPFAVQLQGVFLSRDGDGLSCAGRSARGKNNSFISLEQIDEHKASVVFSLARLDSGKLGHHGNKWDSTINLDKMVTNKVERSRDMLIYLRFETRISRQEGHPDDHL